MIVGKIMNDIIEEKEYLVFNVEDVFELFSGSLISNDKLKEGEIPRITATSNNNGITLFTDEVNDNNFRVYENFISISFLGNVFYQKNKVSLDMKIHGIKPKDTNLNRYIAHYLIPLIKNFSSKYSYGNQLSMRLLKRQRIMLPIKKDNSPDWVFMENRGKEIYRQSLDHLSDYIQEKYNQLVNGISKTNTLPTLSQISWEEFIIEDIVNIKSGVRLTKKDQLEGTIPFIGATEFNNGVTAYISNINNSLDSNVVGVNYNGAVVESFYHPYEAIFSDDVKRIKLKDTSHQNKYVYLFLITMIKMQKKKYMYSYKFNAKRMKKQKILLPVNSDKEPDWNFMENYMRTIEYKQLSKLIEYLN